MVILGIFISALELAQNFCLLGYIISEYIFFLSHTFQFNIFFLRLETRLPILFKDTLYGAF